MVTQAGKKAYWLNPYCAWFPPRAEMFPGCKSKYAGVQGQEGRDSTRPHLLSYSSEIFSRSFRISQASGSCIASIQRISTFEACQDLTDMPAPVSLVY